MSTLTQQIVFSPFSYEVKKCKSSNLLSASQTKQFGRRRWEKKTYIRNNHAHDRGKGKSNFQKANISSNNTTKKGISFLIELQFHSLLSFKGGFATKSKSWWYIWRLRILLFKSYVTDPFLSNKASFRSLWSWPQPSHHVGGLSIPPTSIIIIISLSHALLNLFDYDRKSGLNI